MRAFKKSIAVSKTPYRINLAGATDLIPYVKRFGGDALSGAIDKYVTIVAQRRGDRKIVFHNALKTEEALEARRINQPHVRSVLEHVGINSGVDIASFTDAPLASGLGSSGSFVVGLLNALWTLQGRKKDPRDLAEEAAHIEIKKLNSPIGKHDQYLAAYGGICKLSFLRNGSVEVKKVVFKKNEKEVFEKMVLLVYSGVSRPANQMLSPVERKLQELNPKIVTAMHSFREISSQTAGLLVQRDFSSFGASLNDLWEVEKKTFSNSNERLDELINAGKKQGAIGGLVVGAGGGGFLYLVCPDQRTRLQVSRTLERMGATEYPFSFAEEGSKIIFSQ